MDDEFIVSKCKKCGGKGAVYSCSGSIGGVFYEQLFYIRCRDCGKQTGHKHHVEDAVAEWDLINKQGKMKPKFVCRNCGAEIFLGFARCPKCDMEVEW